MPETSPPLVYYPQYCFHLSPTINKWCPLRAANVQALAIRDEFEGQNVYFHLNHPIKWVRIAGIIVACGEYYGRRVYTIDDGSGVTTECVTRKETSWGERAEHTKPSGTSTEANTGAAAAAGSIDTTDTTGKTGATDTAVTEATPTAESDITTLLGHVVGVKGELRQFRDSMQVQIVQLARLRSTELEVRFWAKAQAFAAGVLCRPWVLDERVVRKCRETAEKSQGRPVVEAKTVNVQRQDRSATERDNSHVTAPASPPVAPRPPKKSKKMAPGPSTAAAAASLSGRCSPPPPPPPKKWSLTSGSATLAQRPANPSPPRRPPPKRWVLGPQPTADSETSPEKKRRLGPEQRQNL